MINPLQFSGARDWPGGLVFSRPPPWPSALPLQVCFQNSFQPPPCTFSIFFHHHPPHHPPLSRFSVDKRPTTACRPSAECQFVFRRDHHPSHRSKEFVKVGARSGTTCLRLPFIRDSPGARTHAHHLIHLLPPAQLSPPPEILHFASPLSLEKLAARDRTPIVVRVAA